MDKKLAEAWFERGGIDSGDGCAGFEGWLAVG